MSAPARSFDPCSPGAQHLAKTWLPHRERWLVRKVVCRCVDDGSVLESETIEVAAPFGRQLVEQGLAEFISRRIISAYE